MEIVHLILGKANPDRLNGVNKVVYQLASKQAASGRNVAVWGIVDKTDHNYGKRNFKTVLFQSKTNPFRIGKALKKAIKLCDKDSVFHFHGGWIPIYSSLARYLTRNNLKFVITAHGSYNTIAMQRSKWMKKFYFVLFEKSVLKRASTIHLIGESERQGLNSIYPNNKWKRIPYGFEMVKGMKDVNSTSDVFVIGFVGRLDIYTKGLDLLIYAYAKFQMKQIESELWIIGDSDQRPELERLAWANNLSYTVKFMGSKFGSEKDTLIKKMDVFVHPSRNEGLPASVIEASNFGVPSIVTRATNMAMFISKYNAGIAVENEDVEGLTQAFIDVYKLKKSGDLFQLSKNAVAMVEAEFDWNKLIVDFDELYK
tara:strand:+ start:4977 stop:6083 length:1107 start_codon:yes stop_codon:yes gene_type:complete